MQYETLSKKGLTLMRITCAIRLAFLLVLAAFFYLSMLIMGSVILGFIVVACTFVFCAAYLFIVPPIRFRRYKFLIAGDRIEIVEGILFVTRTIVPIDRIHQIDIKRGPLDNAAGVAKVIATTAGSAAVFRFLEPEKAEAIALYLNNTVNRKLSVKGAGKDVQ
jgi:membrane protein YdbS with pleckstrin-like domain